MDQRHPADDQSRLQLPRWQHGLRSVSALDIRRWAAPGLLPDYYQGVEMKMTPKRWAAVCIIAGCLLLPLPVPTLFDALPLLLIGVGGGYWVWEPKEPKVADDNSRT